MKFEMDLGNLKIPVTDQKITRLSNNHLHSNGAIIKYSKEKKP